MSIFLLMSFAYQDLPIDKEDQKSLDKAKKINQEAQEYLDKANALFSEIAELEVSGDAKKLEKAKEKALENQFIALELQKEANFLEYKVYKKVIPELQSQLLENNDTVPIEAKMLEEKAVELFNKAEILRNEAYLLDKDDMEKGFTKLNEAQKYEKTGIDNQKKVLIIFIGKIRESDQQPSKETSIDEKVPDEDEIINKDILQIYTNYLNKTELVTTTDLYRELLYSDSLQPSKIRAIWDTYVFATRLELVADDMFVDDSITKDIVADEISEDVTEQAYETIPEDIQELVQEVDETISDILIYKVQFAADKHPLSQKTLMKIYNDKKEISMVTEDGWKKYSIGDFNSYSEADDYRNSIGVRDAFIVSFDADGVKPDLLASEEDEKPEKPEKVISKEVPKEISGLLFKVQIAASREKLADSILNSIYQGDEKIAMIEEDGWYKYSVGKLISYNQAAQLKESVKVKGAFIVAYKDGVKVPMHLAIKGEVPVAEKQKEDVVFKVQIAAHSKSLSSEKLHGIYPGHEKIEKFEEDEWYKYSVGEFKTFAEANEFRKSCGVKGAFIISFQGDKKINVLDAKKMIKCLDPEIITDWIDSDKILFKVQIAASTKEMPKEELKNICCPETKVYMIKEDVWFKYSVGKFNDYKGAAQKKKSIGVKGAFVVAYGKGKKIDIKEAININK